MPLQTAEEVLSEIPKARNKFPKKKKLKEERVVVCGSTKWTDRKRMKQVLSKLDPKAVRYVITGTSKGAETLCTSVCKELKLCVVQVHPMQHLGGSAIHIRNNDVFSFFKPTQVIAFHEDIERSTSSAMYLKLGKRKGIPWQLVDRKPVKKNK